MTETQVLPIITAEQCLMARAALRWSLNDLADASAVGRATIHRFENGGDLKDSTVAKFRQAFEANRVRFVDSGTLKGAVHYLRAGSAE